MSEIKTSKVLKVILEYARSLGEDGSRLLTVERFLAAVLDYVDGKTDIANPDEKEVKAATLPVLSLRIQKAYYFLMKSRKRTAVS